MGYLTSLKVSCLGGTISGLVDRLGVLPKFHSPEARVPFGAKPGQIIDVNLGADSEPLGNGQWNGWKFNSSPPEKGAS